MRCIRLLLPLLVLALGAAPIFAGGPTAKRVEGHDALARGTLDGLSLSADGILRPGPQLDAMPLEVPTAWAAVRHADGALWIGTGNRAALLRVAPDGETNRVEIDGGFLVTALVALPGGDVAAAVFPEARIVRVDARGKTTEIAKLDAEHIWGLALDGDRGLLAACGLPAGVHRVAFDGETESVVEIEDEHVRSLLVHGDEIVIGTAPRGLVLRVTKDGARVLRDLAEEEVVGLVRRYDGSLLIAANADTAGGNAQMLGMYLGQLTKPQPTKPGQTAPKRKALQDGHVYHLEPSGVLTELWTQPKVAILTLAADGTGAVAGTYPSGRVVRVEPGQESSLLADLPEAEASVLVGGTTGLQAIVTSNPAVLHRVREAPPKGTYTSSVIDAGAPSAWGRVTLWTQGATVAEYRTGATSQADATWSAWTPLDGFDGATGKAAGSERFLQLRITLEGGASFLRSMTAVAQTPNRNPVVRELSVTPPGGEGQPAPEADPTRQISWKATDADDDRLATTITVRRMRAAHAVTLVDAKVLTSAEHAWETAGFPDGLYEVTVRVSDAPDNPADRAREATIRHAPVRVDNTAPAVSCRAEVLEGGALRVQGRAADPAGGRIHSVRVSVNGGPWQPLGAEDGLYDDAIERFRTDLRVSAAVAYDVVVQALDAAGNRSAATTTVR